MRQAPALTAGTAAGIRDLRHIAPIRMLGNSDTNNTPNSPCISNTRDARGFANTSRLELAARRIARAVGPALSVRKHKDMIVGADPTIAGGGGHSLIPDTLCR
jgi:hypothetical protein